jgi:hypothetical protein
LVFFPRVFTEMMLKNLARCFSTTARTLAPKTTKTFNKDIIVRNIDETQQRPLMVIVGWSNSKNKQVAKYSDLFEKQGFTTVSVSCKLYRFAMFYDTLFAEDTKNCIDAFDTQRDVNKERRVFFQLFSTPGPAMYVNIMNYYYQYIQGHFGTDTYQNEDKNDVANIRGVVFDSPTVASGNATQFANGMKGNSTNIVTDVIFNWLGRVMYAYAVRNSKMHNHGPEFFRNMPVSIPQLVLFSKADRIAGYQAILDYIKQQRSAGTDVGYRMWEDSTHVLHYRQYPEEYADLVSNFLEQCLAAEISAVPLSESKIFSVMESDISGNLFRDKHEM